ncbi:MAG: S9 family peptidase, partial [Gemmatimonadales bacterium]
MSHSLTALGLAVAASLLPITAQAQAAAQAPRRSLQLEDFYRVRSIGAPTISPDGRWVLYTVSTPVEETNGSSSETWIVSTDGATPPVSIRHQGRGVTAPGWTEDGRVRYTDREAGWTVDPSRPGVEPVESRADSQLGLRSPDGRWLARTRSVPAAPRPAASMTAFEQRHEARFKGTAFDWYPFLQDGRPFPIPDRATEPTVEVVLTPTDGSASERQLTRLGLEASNLRWTADSRALLFTANASRGDELAYGVADIFRVDLEGKSVRLTDDGHNHSGVEISPDGRWYAYIRSLGTDLIIRQKLDHGGAQDLFVQAASGGPAINLTETWDLDAGSPRWSPDSRHLYFTAGIGGAVHLFRVAANGGAVEQITTGSRRISGVTYDRSFRRMAYVASELDRPADLYVADIDGRNERRLTDVNRDLLAEVTMAERPSERVTWKSFDGTEIEGFLLFPKGYQPGGGPYPLIIVNHGGPHAASGYAFDFKQAYFAANGYLVFLPNFRSSTGYGDAF